MEEFLPFRSKVWRGQLCKEKAEVGCIQVHNSFSSVQFSSVLSTLMLERVIWNLEVSTWLSSQVLQCVFIACILQGWANEGGCIYSWAFLFSICSFIVLIKFAFEFLSSFPSSLFFLCSLSPFFFPSSLSPFPFPPPPLFFFLLFSLYIPMYKTVC